jgi:hypothetical protein
MKLNGRRGAFQLLFGLAYLLLAAGYMLQQEPAAPFAWIRVYFPALEFPPLIFTKGGAVLWAAAGTAAIIGAFLPRPKDRFPFQALTFIPVLWGLLSAVSFFAGTYRNGLVGCVLYLAIGGAVMIVSGMAGPHDRDNRPVTLDGEELLPPATGPQEVIQRADAAAREDADGS